MDMDFKYGICEGDTCGRNGCDGVIKLPAVTNCSCHINPPCFQCVSRRCFCDQCGWEEKEEGTITSSTNLSEKIIYCGNGVSKLYVERELDKTKIDFHCFAHTHFSMIKRGVYPIGMTRDEVRKVVDGTFGGRFTYFDDGKFEFIAYTD